ncbi:MAG: hypothetical protein ACREEU_09270, partial [Acetobacteraceae bacterium]
TAITDRLRRVGAGYAGGGAVNLLGGPLAGGGANLGRLLANGPLSGGAKMKPVPGTPSIAQVTAQQQAQKALQGGWAYASGGAVDHGAIRNALRIAAPPAPERGTA